MSQRITQALSADLFELSNQSSLIIFPKGHELAGLPNPTALTYSAELYAALTNHGIKATTEINERFAQTALMISRDKNETLGHLALALEATHENGLVIIDGNKTDGIESIQKQLKTKDIAFQSWSKAHGKTLWFQNPAENPFSEYLSFLEPYKNGAGYNVIEGIFNANTVDKGSKTLLETLPSLKGKGYDLGAGWGVLSQFALEHNPDIEALSLVEIDYRALNCAKENIADPRAQFIWQDVLTYQAEPVDFILMNPPFHTERKANPDLGRAFFKAAAKLLKPSGKLYAVANTQLQYEETLEQCFKSWEIKALKQGYKIIFAKQPKKR